jgi:hypothetical protein
MGTADVKRWPVTAILIVILGMGATALLSGPDHATGTEHAPVEPTQDWTMTELTDVNSGETFTLAELDEPVLVETFAVWCTTCTKQQNEIKTLHDQHGEVTSVTLNIDPNEDAAAVRDHTETHGFDWRYAVAPPAMTQDLIKTFGRSITVAPRAPVVLICSDGTTERLPDGVKPADTLWQHVQETCGA